MDYKAKHGSLMLDRRGFMGAMALTGASVAGGGFTAAAPVHPPKAAVFMDMPFVDATGTHPPYVPPVVRYTVAELGPEHRFFA